MYYIINHNKFSNIFKIVKLPFSPSLSFYLKYFIRCVNINKNTNRSRIAMLYKRLVEETEERTKEIKYSIFIFF